MLYSRPGLPDTGRMQNLRRLDLLGTEVVDMGDHELEVLSLNQLTSLGLHGFLFNRWQLQAPQLRQL